MMNGSMKRSVQKAGTSRTAIIAGVLGGGVVLGVVGGMSYGQFKAQEQQIAQMNALVQQLAQSNGTLTTAPAADGTAQVTRDAAPDLLTVERLADQTAQALRQSVPSSTDDAQLGGGDIVLASAAPYVGAPTTAAGRLQSVVSKSLGAEMTPIPPASSEDPETKNAQILAAIEAGVAELAQAVVDGNYKIHTDHKDVHFAGRIHFTFVGFEDKQRALGKLLVKAANKGIIQYSDAVVCSQGLVNGEILLFDLVERALAEGTPQERMAGLKMNKEAKALLAQKAVAEGKVNEGGDQFYVVEAGDSLAYIALQFYGNTNEFARIFNANREQIAQPNDIRIGQRLRIPSA